MKRLVLGALIFAFMAPSFLILNCYRDLLEQVKIGMYSVSSDLFASKNQPNHLKEMLETQGGSPYSSKEGEHYQAKKSNTGFWLKDEGGFKLGEPKITVSGQILEVRFITDQNGKVTFSVFDVGGYKILCREEIVYSGENCFEFDLKYISPGVYYLETESSSGISVTKFLSGSPAV